MADIINFKEETMTCEEYRRLHPDDDPFANDEDDEEDMKLLEKVMRSAINRRNKETFNWQDDGEPDEYELSKFEKAMFDNKYNWDK